MAHRPASLYVALLLVLGASSACDSESVSGPDPSRYTVRIASGDDQWARPGSPLGSDLEIAVANGTDPVVNAEITWTVTQGPGAVVDPAAGRTDAAGRAAARLTLGPDPGEVTVEAGVVGGSAVRFRARSVAPPVLTSLSETSVAAGDTIVLGGTALAPQQRRTVLFSGIPGRALGGSSTAVAVEVPPCLVTGSVNVTVRVDGDSTVALPLHVTAAGLPRTLGLGDDLTLDAVAGAQCERLEMDADNEYLVVVQSAGTRTGAPYRYRLVGLREGSAAPSADGRVQVVRDRPDGHRREVWETPLRERERSLWFPLDPAPRRNRHVSRSGAGTPVEAAPAVGDTGTFTVLNSDNVFDTVQATVRHVGVKAVWYVDTAVGEAGFPAADLATLAEGFDGPVTTVVDSLFGAPSDLDGNGLVVVLATPVVNGLTPPESATFIGGFFFGADLNEENAGSNRAEIFYTVVPDPAGQYGPAISRERVTAGLPAILAHEYQHMVHFNQRRLVLEADRPEALWLSEALAQMAEDRVAAWLEAAGRPEAGLYAEGNRDRAQRYLGAPESVSLLITAGAGTLAERGAGWLFARYLRDRSGDGILGALTRTTRTGTDNVAAAVGASWPDLFSDWSAALFLDGLGVAVAPDLVYPDADLRGLLALDGAFPLVPERLPDGSLERAAEIFPATSAYYLIQEPIGGGRDVALALTGAFGEPPEPQSGLRVRIVRIR